MIRMYRFGQQVTHFDSVSAETRAELVAANTAFAAAVPLLWDEACATGDSRAPGFAAAAKYALGAVDDDAALRAQGLADLEHAVQLNSFFNFRPHTDLQILLAERPVFQQTFALVTSYLSDPATLQCASRNPNSRRRRVRSAQRPGPPHVFGDLLKAGDLGQAQSWYGLASAFPDTASWRFVSVIQDRTTNAAARVALYKDSDPSNDPPIIGAGAEACAFCHQR